MIINIGDPIPLDSEIVFEATIGGRTITVVLVEDKGKNLPASYDVYADNAARHIGCNKSSVFNALTWYYIPYNKR